MVSECVCFCNFTIPTKLLSILTASSYVEGACFSPNIGQLYTHISDVPFEVVVHHSRKCRSFIYFRTLWFIYRHSQSKTSYILIHKKQNNFSFVHNLICSNQQCLIYFKFDFRWDIALRNSLPQTKNQR